MFVPKMGYTEKSPSIYFHIWVLISHFPSSHHGSLHSPDLHPFQFQPDHLMTEALICSLSSKDML